uniref:Transmembrane protein n=1 Tax=Davidia involucrata TaxID=16924 RepID=A0A5B7AZ37_DAVIN
MKERLCLEVRNHHLHLHFHRRPPIAIHRPYWTVHTPYSPLLSLQASSLLRETHTHSIPKPFLSLLADSSLLPQSSPLRLIFYFFYVFNFCNYLICWGWGLLRWCLVVDGGVVCGDGSMVLAIVVLFAVVGL